MLLFAVGAAAVGQVMLKHGMQIASARAADTRGSLAFAAATSPWVLFGLMVFAVSATAWLAALSRVPLSVAYPFNALGYLANPDREHPRPPRTGERVDLGGLAPGGVGADHRRADAAIGLPRNSAAHITSPAGAPIRYLQSRRACTYMVPPDRVATSAAAAARASGTAAPAAATA